MKLVLDWDEDTIDSVVIAICAHMHDMQEELDKQRRVHDVAGCRVHAEGCILDLAQAAIDGLRKALSDLLGEEQRDQDGIYPVKELLGAHEVRVLKEEA